MIKKIFIILFLFVVSVSAVQAANLSNAFETGDTSIVGSAASGAGYKASANLEDIIGAAILTFLSILGVIFIILMLYGGYTWMMARGNEEEVKKAQGIIRRAVIGIIIIVAAYAISYLVIYVLGNAALNTGT